jgi:ribosome biogenesis SPOUT family RNA methylase Rps3
MPNHKTYIVEHLDPELGPWSELEYIAIARETARAGGQFVLSSIPAELKANLPAKLTGEPAFRAETRGVEELYPEGSEERKRVCLLDPRAEKDINPDDKALFDVFLFGGILGEFLFLLLLFCIWRGKLGCRLLEILGRVLGAWILLVKMHHGLEYG